jgi:hypothetical protein
MLVKVPIGKRRSTVADLVCYDALTGVCVCFVCFVFYLGALTICVDYAYVQTSAVPCRNSYMIACRPSYYNEPCNFAGLMFCPKFFLKALNPDQILAVAQSCMNGKVCAHRYLTYSVPRDFHVVTVRKPSLCRFDCLEYVNARKTLVMVT